MGDKWLDTGINIEGTANLTISASGEVDLRPTALPGNYISTPRGYTRVAAGGFPGGVAKKKITTTYPGTLVGRIGANGETFIIGDRFEGPASAEGKLYLQILPSPYEAALGSYQVKISVRE